GSKPHRQITVDTADRDCRGDRPRHLVFDRLGALEPEPTGLRVGLWRNSGHTLFLVVGVHCADDISGTHFAAPDGRHDILDRSPSKSRKRAGELFLGIGHFRALTEPLDDPAPQSGILVTYRYPSRPPNSGSSLAGLDQG